MGLCGCARHEMYVEVITQPCFGVEVATTVKTTPWCGWPPCCWGNSTADEMHCSVLIHVALDCSVCRTKGDSQVECVAPMRDALAETYNDCVEVVNGSISGGEGEQAGLENSQGVGQSDRVGVRPCHHAFVGCIQVVQQLI